MVSSLISSLTGGLWFLGKSNIHTLSSMFTNRWKKFSKRKLLRKVRLVFDPLRSYGEDVEVYNRDCKAFLFARPSIERSSGSAVLRGMEEEFRRRGEILRERLSASVETIQNISHLLEDSSSLAAIRSITDKGDLPVEQTMDLARYIGEANVAKNVETLCEELGLPAKEFLKAKQQTAPRPQKPNGSKVQGPIIGP
jgi:hypothetical protein